VSNSLDNASVTTPGAAPVSERTYRVQRWRKSRWVSVTTPLSRADATAKANELKQTVSAFHVRIVEEKA
jgi:hypothetical protein